jgi:predicted dehydrogenase
MDLLAYGRGVLPAEQTNISRDEGEIMRNSHPQSEGLSRRSFIKTTALAASAAAVVRPGYTAGTDTLKVGLIGCGGRGTRAAIQSLTSTKQPIQLVAMGDVFQDQIDAAMAMLAKGSKKRYDAQDSGPLADKLAVPKERQFTGFDAYKKVLATDCNVVICATPPAFRPEHFRAAIEAGKHVFMEKPVAVDPAGIRMVIAAAEQADAKKLCVVAGTQRRHQDHYIEIMKRVHGGEIGDVITAEAYWNMGPLWLEEADRNWAGKAKWSDMEWQLRNWLFTSWISGDHICEQHVHNLDIMNWALKGHPVKAMAMGGRQARTDPKYGNIFDHFAADLEYPNGVHVASYCRQMEGSSNLMAERIVGSKGFAFTTSDGGYIQGPKPYKVEADSLVPYYQEHADLINAILTGKRVNEGRQVAESTMVAIISRMSAYTAKDVEWEWAMKESKLKLVPDKLDMTAPLPLAPVAVPGKTELV